MILFYCILPKPIAWTLPQVVGTNLLPTYYQGPRASLTAWWCIIETKSFHVAKTSHWAKVSHWVKMSHWAKVSHWVKVSHSAKVSHWVKVSHWRQFSYWVFQIGFPLLNGGWYRCACSIILWRIDRLFLSNGICGCVASCVLITSHALLILLVVQNCRGRPRLLCSVSRGSADLVENAAWCSGCCLSLLKTCQEVSVFCLPEFRLVVWFVSQVLLMASW